MSKAVEAINNRLKQLEDIETRLYLATEAIVQRRAREDLQRQEEDRNLLEALRERDQEEDELRRRRRILCRSSFGLLTADFRYDESQVTTDTEYGPGTRGRTKIKRSATKLIVSSLNSGRKDYGLPSARDSQGRDLFTRPSDGKLVYLLCCVPNCGKANFPNALALRNHVCAPGGLHKIKGLIKSNAEAIEVCGQVAPGQEESSTTARDQAFEAAPVANTTLADALLSHPADSDEYQHQSKAWSWSNTDTEPEAGSGMERFKAQDVGRAYRTRSSYNGDRTGSRTRAEEAAEVFDGFMSSDSEDSDESEDGFLQGHLTPNLGAEPVATRKRAISAPPVTPPAITKRLRITDEKVARLVRS